MNTIIIVGGPTACGKTEYAIEIAKALDGEIVSCDSMQLYKYMDIGSAKPNAHELAQVRHHLVDVIDPREKFSAAKYQKLAREAIDDILSRGKTPVIAGGTGLYINSVIYDMNFSSADADEDERNRLRILAEKEGPEALHKLLQDADPDAAARIHPNNIKKVIRAIEAARSGNRIPDFDKSFVPYSSYSPKMIALTRDREELYDRINRRVEILFDKGLVDELVFLKKMGLSPDDISMKGIGYKEVLGYLDGRYSLEETKELVKKNTRHYAKRQLTWLRRYKDIRFFNLSEYEDKNAALEDIISWLKKKQ